MKNFSQIFVKNALCGVVGSERIFKRVWETSQQAKSVRQAIERTGRFTEKGTLFLCLLRMFFFTPYNTQKTVLPNFYKRKTLQSSKDYNASQTVFSCALDVYSSPVSTFLISFAVAVIICNPVSLIPSSSVSSCLRCVDLLATLSGKKN